MPSSERLQQRHAAVLACRKFNGACNRAAEFMGKPVAFVKRWYKRWQVTRDVQDRPRKGRPAVFTVPVRARAQKLLGQLQSCTEVTAALISDGAIPAKTNRSTTWRHVIKGADGMECGPEQLIPAITPYIMAKRRRFAQC